MQAPEEVTAQQQVVVMAPEKDWEAATTVAVVVDVAIVAAVTAVVADAAIVAVAMAAAMGRAQQVGAMRIRCMARAQPCPNTQRRSLPHASRSRKACRSRHHTISHTAPARENCRSSPRRT